MCLLFRRKECWVKQNARPSFTGYTKPSAAHSLSASVGGNCDCPIDVLPSISIKARVFVRPGIHQLVEAAKITSQRTCTVAWWCRVNENRLTPLGVDAPYVPTYADEYSLMHPISIKDAIAPDYRVRLAGFTWRRCRLSHRRQACIHLWTSEPPILA